MSTIGIMIRKKDYGDNGKIQYLSRKKLKKQIYTLHRKLKKNDKELTTSYVIEKDIHHKGKFHTHLLINFTDEKNIYNQLSRFIGGSSWEERTEGFDKIYGCYGKYGEVDSHYIYDEREFQNYLNKTEQTETLV